MNNLTRVSKRHVGNTKGTRLDMNALDTMLEDAKGIKKCIWDITSIKVKNTNLFLNQWLLQNMVWRTLGTLERLNYFLKATKGTKKDIMSML